MEVPVLSLNNLKPFHGHPPGVDPDDITRNYRPKIRSAEQALVVATEIASLQPAAKLLEVEL